MADDEIKLERLDPVSWEALVPHPARPEDFALVSPGLVVEYRAGEPVALYRRMEFVTREEIEKLYPSSTM
jgi:hypothetical protein